MRHELVLSCHPATPCPAVRAVQVSLARHADQLRLSYVIHAPPAVLRWPQRAGAERCDELWQHTCAELFITIPAAQSYREFNFSPSSAWAAYDFADYRQGMQLGASDPPEIELAHHAETSAISVALALPAPWRAAPQLTAAVTMVVEAQDGHRSYWAVHHPPGAPDFHHRAGFVVEL